MFFGIVGALDAEVDLIRSSMNVEETVDVYGSPCYRGTYCGHQVAVICCSIGKVNAALCASVLIREMGANAVINVGIAGAVGPGLKVLDVVLSEQVVFHDVDLDLFERYRPGQRGFSADSKLLNACVDLLGSRGGRGFSFHTGIIATGDVFVNDPQVKGKIVERLSPLCVEMEGAAIGQACYMNRVPFLIIRTMSDNADEEADVVYDNFLERAAEQSSRIVLDLMEHSPY